MALIIVFILTSCQNTEKIYSDKEINTEDLEQVIGNYSEVTHLFLFSRYSCESCVDSIESLNYVYEELKNNNPGDKFYYFNHYDTDENRKNKNFEETLEYLEILTVPAIIIYDYEKDINHKIDDIEIIQNKEYLLKEILDVLQLS